MKTRRILLCCAAAVAATLPSAPLFGQTSLSWEQTEIKVDADFGQQEVNAYYTFTNTSDQPITITDTQTSCGCTVPSLEKKTYAPGESGKLLATFDIGSRLGKQRKEIKVSSQEADGTGSYTLVLSVDIPQLIQLKRRALLWRVGDDADTKDCEIILHARRPMDINQVAFKNGDGSDSQFTFEVETLEPKQKFLLKITPKTTDTKVRETVFLSSPDDTGNALKNFPIYAWVR